MKLTEALKNLGLNEAGKYFLGKKFYPKRKKGDNACLVKRVPAPQRKTEGSV